MIQTKESEVKYRMMEMKSPKVILTERILEPPVKIRPGRMTSGSMYLNLKMEIIEVCDLETCVRIDGGETRDKHIGNVTSYLKFPELNPESNLYKAL